MKKLVSVLILVLLIGMSPMTALASEFVEQEENPWNGKTAVFVGDSVTAPTCTEEGYTTPPCTICGESYVDSKVAAKGHTNVTVPGKAATCAATGLTDGAKCSVCGVVTKTQQTIAAKGHTNVTVPGKAATCTAPGLTDGAKCSVCGVVTKV